MQQEQISRATTIAEHTLHCTLGHAWRRYRDVFVLFPHPDGGTVCPMCFQELLRPCGKIIDPLGSDEQKEIAVERFIIDSSPLEPVLL